MGRVSARGRSMSTSGALRVLPGACALVAACLFTPPAPAACPQEGCETDPPNKVTLTVTVTGSGTVKNGAATICSSGVCQRSFEEGQSVSLSATPGTGMTFMGWGGACSSSGMGTCSLTMDEDKAVTATFEDKTPPEPPTVTFPAAGEKIESANGEVNVKFTDFDGSAKKFRCRVDVNDAIGASACSSATGWNTGPLAVGPHTVYVWAEDSVGNRSAPGSSAFEIVRPQESGGGTPPPSGIGTPLPTERVRPPTPRATGQLSARWKVQGAWTYVRKLLLTDLPQKGRVQVRCTGTGCPFKQRKAATSGGRATVTPLFGKHALHAGAVIELRIGAPGMTTKVFVLKIRSGKAPKLIRR
jgi:hypothetical protein